MNNKQHSIDIHVILKTESMVSGHMASVALSHGQSKKKHVLTYTILQITHHTLINNTHIVFASQEQILL